ncbi:MAG: hypothetical protein OXJ52_09345 [Oligoflexia bacterium]|nr:hypothetical protein [Oligoflexia bacterium]
MTEKKKTKKILKEKFFELYNKDFNQAEWISLIVGLLLFSLMFFFIGSFFSIYYNKFFDKLNVHPIELCIFDRKKENVRCIVRPCEDSKEKCKKDYNKKYFLTKNQHQGFVIVDDLNIYFQNDTNYEFFCKYSKHCRFKTGQYTNNSIQEFDSVAGWKKKKDENNMLNFRYKPKDSIMDATLKELCKNYKKVLK